MKNLSFDSAWYSLKNALSGLFYIFLNEKSLYIHVAVFILSIIVGGIS